MKLILGITGQTGSAAATHLLDRGEKVRALVRDKGKATPWGERGVELVQGQADDADALAAALGNVNGIYALVPPAPTHPDPTGWYEAVATAVRQAVDRVRPARLVFLSSEGAQLAEGTGAIGNLRKAERILAGAAARTTFLRPAYFQENWRGLLPLAQAEGILPSTIGALDQSRAMVATGDIGVAAAELLLAHEPPSIVELSGPADLTSLEVADAFAAALGRPVHAVAPPRSEWSDILIQAGFGAPFAAQLIEMYEAIGSGHVRFSGEVPLQLGDTRLVDNVVRWTAEDLVNKAG